MQFYSSFEYESSLRLSTWFQMDQDCSSIRKSLRKIFWIFWTWVGRLQWGGL